MEPTNFGANNSFLCLQHHKLSTRIGIQILSPIDQKVIIIIIILEMGEKWNPTCLFSVHVGINLTCIDYDWLLLVMIKYNWVWSLSGFWRLFFFFWWESSLWSLGVWWNPFFLAQCGAECSVVELDCGGHQWWHPAADSFPDTRNPLRSLNRSPNGARGVWIVLFRVDLIEMGLISAMRGINSGASLSQRVIDAKRLSKMGCKT